MAQSTKKYMINSKAYLQNFEAKLDSMNIKYLKYIDKLNLTELGNTEESFIT